MFTIKSLNSEDFKNNEFKIMFIESETMKLTISDKFGLQFVSIGKGVDDQMPIYPKVSNQIGLGMSGGLTLTRINSDRDLDIEFKEITVLDTESKYEYTIKKMNDYLSVSKSDDNIAVQPNVANSFTVI